MPFVPDTFSPFQSNEGQGELGFDLATTITPAGLAAKAKLAQKAAKAAEAAKAAAKAAKAAEAAKAAATAGKATSKAEKVVRKCKKGTSDVPSEPYNRRKHYGNTPKKSDRKALETGPDEVVDHDPPLVKRYYEGDPETGEKPGYQMTPEERRTSANDRNRMNNQPKAESHKQGGEMSNYSKKKKKELGL